MKGDRLTDCEERVCKLLVEGCNAEQVAARMGVSPWTVRSHIFNARAKLGARSLLQLAVLFDRTRR